MDTDVLEELMANALLETVERLAILFLAYGHSEDKVYEALKALFLTLDPGMSVPFENLREASEHLRKMREAE